MNINATLLGEMLTFAVLVWVTMRFVWPPLLKAMGERQKKIADGLAAAERGHHEFELARGRAVEELRGARRQAAEIVEQATHRSAQLVEEARVEAGHEGERLIKLAKEEIALQVDAARQQLRQRAAALAIQGAEKILRHKIDAVADQALLDQLIEEM